VHRLELGVIRAEALDRPTASRRPRSRKLKKVIAGSRSASVSSAKLCSGGVCPSANARCRSSSARTSGLPGSSTAISPPGITLATVSGLCFNDVKSRAVPGLGPPARRAAAAHGFPPEREQAILARLGRGA